MESRLYVAKQFANAALPESEPAHDSGCHVRHTAISAVKRDLSCIYCVMASREHGTTETDHTTVDGPKEPPPVPHCIQGRLRFGAMAQCVRQAEIRVYSCLLALI